MTNPAAHERIACHCWICELATEIDPFS